MKFSLKVATSIENLNDVDCENNVSKDLAKEVTDCENCNANDVSEWLNSDEIYRKSKWNHPCLCYFLKPLSRYWSRKKSNVLEQQKIETVSQIVKFSAYHCKINK